MATFTCGGTAPPRGFRHRKDAFRFEVGGAVESADEALEVRVDVFNAGDVAATAVDVRGEFADEADVVTLPEGIPAGATRSALFRFAHVPRAGVHVLGLRLDYTEAAAAGRVAVTTSQRAASLSSAVERAGRSNLRRRR